MGRVSFRPTEPNTDPRWHIYIPPSPLLPSLQDAKGGRRRLLLSSSVKEPSISPLIARVPLVSMTTGQVNNHSTLADM